MYVVRLVTFVTIGVALSLAGCSNINTLVEDEDEPRKGFDFRGPDGSVPEETPPEEGDPPEDPTLVYASSHNCGAQGGYPLYEYQGPADPGPHLNVVGVYEASSDHSGVNHPFHLHIEAPGARVLALSAYEPVHWIVTTEPGVVLEQVILDGYYHHTADVPAGVPVSEYTYAGTQGYLSSGAYVWPDDQDGDTSALLSGLYSLTGLDPHSFHGCYNMSQLTLAPVP